jgi:hypothetical protein
MKIFDGYEVRQGRRVFKFTNDQANHFNTDGGALIISNHGSYVMAFSHWDYIKVLYTDAVV